MNASTKSLTIPLTLAGIWLAACDKEITGPPQQSIIATTGVSDDNPASAIAAEQSSGAGALTHPASHFQIEVIPVDDGGEDFQSAIREAAGRWMALLRGTEFPNMSIGQGPKPACVGLRLDHSSRVIDDLAILASVRRIDGVGGTLAFGGPCWVHWESSLPYLGAIILDRADVEELGARELTELLVHEIGHVLGIGSLWDAFGLLRSPSLSTPGADTHFEGPLAISAFDAAGGEDYADGKVPVENVMGSGSSDGHWRESVLAAELMTPVLMRGETHPLSAITIQSLADLGYTVDVGLADAFTLPAEGGGSASGQGARGRAISLGGDIVIGPLLAFDTDGRMVRVLRN